ncbi:hypothetical protein L5515_017204 [Caenorhabditis briggsae]|uniref:SAM domain-containing protein n=1 Tax=Caenorhabditis briggsae TaxID=6238 RepID=A0AAE9FIY9_CAEBR|nr:hypothetical protein L5515_017204 [Caenorhabditis briggsae]
MNNHAAPEAAGPLEKRIKIELVDPDFPPSKPPTPPPKPAAKFYLPPGKSTNVSLWTVEDVRLWVEKFLKRSEHAETFRTLAELEINGAVIKSIYEKKPAHTTFGINSEDFEAIQAHAHKLFNIRIANNYWDDPAYEYFLPNNIHFRLAGPAELNPPEIFRQASLPRGKTTDVSLWTEKDVRCWVAKFLKRSEHVETFRTLKELKIDGAEIESIYLNKPAHTTYGINLEDYEAIQAHAHKVFMAQDTSGIRWLQSPFRCF